MIRSSLPNRPSSILRSYVIGGLVLCVLLALSIWMPNNVIRPAYPPQTLPETVALERLGESLTIRFRRRGERSVTLRGWRLDGRAQAGSALDLHLTWYASSRQVRDWVVFVHLVDEQGRLVAKTDSQPRDGVFPTTQWNIGDWIEDRHRIQLPDNLPNGNYTLRIGLFDPGMDNRRAGVYRLGGEAIGDAFDLGQVLVNG